MTIAEDCWRVMRQVRGLPAKDRMSYELENCWVDKPGRTSAWTSYEHTGGHNVEFTLWHRGRQRISVSKEFKAHLASFREVKRVGRKKKKYVVRGTRFYDWVLEVSARDAEEAKVIALREMRQKSGNLSNLRDRIDNTKLSTSVLIDKMLE